MSDDHIFHTKGLQLLGGNTAGVSAFLKWRNVLRSKLKNSSLYTAGGLRFADGLGHSLDMHEARRHKDDDVEALRLDALRNLRNDTVDERVDLLGRFGIEFPIPADDDLAAGHRQPRSRVRSCS